MPLWLWVGAHVLAHHEHVGERAAGLAMALVHGHEHEEGVPDHEHRLLPSPSIRQNLPREIQVPVVVFLAAAPVLERLASSGPRLESSSTALTGSSPPLLHLLCTLLI